MVTPYQQYELAHTLELPCPELDEWLEQLPLHSVRNANTRVCNPHLDEGNGQTQKDLFCCSSSESLELWFLVPLSSASTPSPLMT